MTNTTNDITNSNINNANNAKSAINATNISSAKSIKNALDFGLDSHLRVAFWRVQSLCSRLDFGISRVFYRLFATQKDFGFKIAFYTLAFRFYKIVISPLFPRSCRFYPTCSHFAYLSFRHSNPFRAFIATIFRLVRCQPFCEGGFDYPVIYAELEPANLWNLGNVRGFVRDCGADCPKISAWLIPLESSPKNAKDYKIYRHKSPKQACVLIPSIA